MRGTPIRKAPRLGSLSYCGAFNRNRTGDLILTMDALYLLSYKGVMVCGADDGNRTRVISLGSWSSAIELHPRLFGRTLNYTSEIPCLSI